ncbi:STAS/SEC14 domain-containing protein [Halomonas sp. ZH2S]|uniref:STAS/SEC14 domain-containing protein n=1 Tax=Vreelandella zhuhanensis TaxID=2684210 RepID=A0A7X3GXY0_9GAMM|nr:STAS/SEC14 domain-containing protein [Halomonas zhuhanensis]MWJ26945.1 STAS/SEC14 domain-containing protein [Halomonas zhuhanensis]
MLESKLDENRGIITLHPGDELREADFEYATRLADEFLEKGGEIKGVIINTRDFPGWESFNAMLTHFRFIRDYHEKIPKVALVTDSAVGKVGEKVADHFVAAEIRHFPFDDLKDAEQWVLEEKGTQQR